MYQRLSPIDWSGLRVDLNNAIAPLGLIVGNVAPMAQPHSVRLTMSWSFGGGQPVVRDVRLDGSLGDALGFQGRDKTFADAIFHLALAKAGLHPMPTSLAVSQIETALQDLVESAPLLQLAGIKLPAVIVDDAKKVLGLIESGAIHDKMSPEEIIAAVSAVSTAFGLTLPGMLDTALVAAEHVTASISSIEHGQYALLGSGDVPLPTKGHEECILILASKRSDIAGVVYGTKQITDVPA